MLIIPAIDIRGGRCVRLVQGDPAREIRYDADPVVAAQRWTDLGARRLHVVDLDGALAGRPVHLDLVGRIAERAGVPVQVGGGFRTWRDVQEGLQAAAWVVLGTAAAAIVGAAPPGAMDRIIAAVDARGGRTVVVGWTADTGLDPAAVASDLAARGLRRFVYTDVSADGTLAGPDVAAVRAFVTAVRRPVIAAGGIGSERDIAALAATGVEGVIIGRALYEGRVDFAAAAARWEGVRAG